MDTKRFMLAGKATFTVSNPETGNHFTYRVRAKDIGEGRTLHFVQVLTGPDNESSYSYLGTIFEGTTYKHGRKSRISESAPSARAFEWVFSRITTGEDLKGVCVQHAGRCGRKLTVPESISTGFGPECASLLAA